jgi:hypothetical protein
MILSDFDPSLYLTPAQLVERWKDSPFPASLVTLARWRRVGRGPRHIRGGHNDISVFYSLREVEAYEQTLISNI